jgi:hypothetical protein
MKWTQWKLKNLGRWNKNNGWYNTYKKLAVQWIYE